MKLKLYATCVITFAFVISSHLKVCSQTCITAPLIGGNVSTTNSYLCAGLYCLLSVSGGTTSGVTYQWESSDNNIAWAAIPGTTLATYSTNQPGFYYRRKVICTSGGSIAYSSAIKINAQDFLNCYCIPWNNCSNVFISNVTYATINNTSVCSPGTYINYRGSIAAPDIMQGSMLPVSVTVNENYAGNVVQCYVDFDHSGSFTEKENITLSSVSGNVYSSYIRVPFHAFTGITIMRVVYSPPFTGYSSTCGPNYPSEVEDYAINIIPNTSSSANGHVIYVKQTAAGSDQSGRSWANACTNLQRMVQTASSGDTIKIARGFYYSGSGTAATDGFVLQDSVVMLGGYPATGSPTNADRKPGANLSILRGYQSNGTGNYHVLYANGAMPSCIVDGCVLEGGGNYNGTTASQLRGGGFSAENGANPTLKNCIIRSNNSYMKGTAVAVNHSSPNFYNCIITGNTNNTNGGILLIENVSNALFNNMLITGNTAANLIYADLSGVSLRNNTIANNNISNNIINAVRQSSINIANTITFYNSGTPDTAELQLNASTVSIVNSLMQVTTSGVNTLTGYQPKFKNISNVAGTDGVYFTADDGLSLVNPCSPAINAGDNAQAANNPTDITGAVRIFDGIIDIGAYEVQQAKGTIPTTLYVRSNATGLNNGSSWANAFTSLNSALQTCSDTIKVAAGNYNPYLYDTQPFWLDNKRIILGAYPATGNPANTDRNYNAHITTFSNASTSYAVSNQIVRGVGLDSTSVLDGITFSTIGTNQPYHIPGSIIYYTNCNNPVVSNCFFTTNVRELFQGWNNRNPLLLNCNFYNNTLPETQSSLLNLLIIRNSNATTFKNCSFRNNILEMRTATGGEFGKIFNVYLSNPVFDNCVFQRNRATVMYNVWSNTIVRNSNFLNNYTAYNPSDLKNEYANPSFTNCIFKDSAWSYLTSPYGGIMKNEISNPVFTDCKFYDGKAYDAGGLAYNDSSLAQFTRCIFSNCNSTFVNRKQSNIVLNNCISTGSNSINPYGGSFMNNAGSSPVITNCAIVNGSSDVGGVINSNASSFPQINNCIIWKNYRTATTDTAVLNSRSDIVDNVPGQTVVRNSMLEYYKVNTIGTNTRAVDPRFINFSNPIGADSIWFTADDGLQLCNCSPAINSGDNAYAAATDISGAARIFGPVIDRGAYELQTIPPVPVPTTFFVNAAASGANTGTSWSDAYTSLQTAINNPCTDTIKIAAGTYTPARYNRDSAFNITRSMVLLGSYNPANPAGAREVDVTPTILSGDIGVAGNNADNSMSLMNAFYIDTLKMDGLVFKDANRNVNTNTSSLALTARNLQTLDINNCRFYENISTQGSSTISLAAVKKFDIRKTVFRKNKAASGSGISLLGNGLYKKITDCIFDQNDCYAQGGAISSQEGGVAIVNCLFIGNTALYGSGIYLDNANADMQITNCTFANNRVRSSGFAVGAGIYSSGASWQGGGIGPHIENCIFTGNSYVGSDVQYSYMDIYYPKNGYQPSNGQVELRIHHSAVTTQPAFSICCSNTNISPGSISYKNPANPIGPDNKWFTADDGLQLNICSGGINMGQNSSNPTLTDLAGKARIFNNTIDLGPYEFSGSPEFARLLTTPNDSLIANKEITDAAGWTHYYKDCYYLMSVQKSGQNIGTVGDGTFSVKIKTTSAYGSGTATDLSSANYINPGVSWKVMNRYWAITATNQPADSIQVRFPYTAADFTDVRGATPTITTHQQMIFYKLDSTYNPLNTNASADKYHSYTYAAQPSKIRWTFSTPDTTSFTASYFVKTLAGCGGGGISTVTCTSNTNTWLGITPDWGLATNWSAGQIPTVCSNVIINTGVPFAPEITSPNSACYSLTLMNGATIIIRTGGNLTITGP